MGKIVFLGVEGSGKTSLAMAFISAFKRHRDEGWYLSPKSRDAYAFAERLSEVFTLEGFPAQTSSAQTLAWDLEYRNKKIHEVSIFDYPGELLRQAFLDGRSDMTKEMFDARVKSESVEIRVMLDSIGEAEHIYVLLNLDDAVNLRSNARNIDAVWATNECLKFVEQLPGSPEVTLLFTQVDRYGNQKKIQDRFKYADVSLIAHDHPNLKWCNGIGVWLWSQSNQKVPREVQQGGEHQTTTASTTPNDEGSGSDCAREDEGTDIAYDVVERADNAYNVKPSHTYTMSSVTIDVRINDTVPAHVLVTAPNAPDQYQDSFELIFRRGDKIGPFEVFCKHGGKYYYQKYLPIEFNWAGKRKSGLVFRLKDKNLVTHGEKFDFAKSIFD